jgi:hypothetical protein
MSIHIFADWVGAIPDASRYGPDSREDFRRAMEHRLRPRLNAMRDRLADATVHQAIAPGFFVMARTGGQFVTFVLGNRNPASPFLLSRSGVKPHVITQRPHIIPLPRLIDYYGSRWLAGVVQAAVARRGVVIQHPGIRPDPTFWEVYDQEIARMEGEVDAAYSLWAKNFIQEWGRSA